MATASTFSYAQAAKGQGAPTTQTSATSQTPEGTEATPSTEKPVEVQSSEKDAPQESAKPDAAPVSIEKQDTESVSAVDSESRTESVTERRSESRRDDEASRLDRPWRRNDKGTRSSSTATRSVDEQDSRRSRKGKKGKNSDKQTGEGSTASADREQKEEEAPKVELSEAPIPSVNIWAQRKAQQAPVTKPMVNGTSGDAQGQQTPARAAEGSHAAPVAVNGSGKTQQKTNEKPERNGSRGNRAAGKTVVPPPVDDAGSWPTPETAVKEEKKKPAEKSDRPEATQEDGAQAKPRQKEKWLTYEYVPSVNFETQLPQMRGSKPRGGAKAANGARSAGNNDKAASSTKNESRDRPREAANGTSRNTSQPPTNKRASMDVVNNKNEQRRAAQNAGAEKAKEAGSNASDQQTSTREGRSDRGRGGFRGGRGGHAMNPHAQHHHSASSVTAPPFTPNNGSIPPRPQGPISPPPRQSNGQPYMPPPQRGGRGGRNGGATNYHNRMSLPNGSRPLPIHTQFPGWEIPMQPMSAVPFQPQQFWDPNNNNITFPMLKQQIEYYFSLDNLCKDMFLRRHMDSQGFVPFHFVASFKRVKELASSDYNIIRNVCEESDKIDLVQGDDGQELLRSRHHWEGFVMPIEERDEGARNAGPQNFQYKSRSYNMPQFNPMAPGPYNMASPYGAGSPPANMQQANPDFMAGHNGVNGYVNGFVNGNGANTQLSANVPDFAPTLPTGEAMVNGHASAPVVNGEMNGDHSQES